MKIDIGMYLDEEDGRLDAQSLDERIELLKEVRAEGEEDGAAMDGDLAAELGELVAFRARVVRVVGHFNEWTTMVPDNQFEKFARYAAERDHGIGPDNVGDFVDWAAYAKNWQATFMPVPLSGTDIWVGSDT